MTLIGILTTGAGDRPSGAGGTQVPYILTCLLRAIEDLGGLDCEGIFRLSGKQTEEENLINRYAPHHHPCITSTNDDDDVMMLLMTHP
jgi:hypothetical protein